MALDEPHAAHVGGEVVDDGGSLQRGDAVFTPAEIQLEVFHALVDLVPMLERLDVHRSDAGLPLPFEIGDEVPADEASSAGNNRQIRVHVSGGVRHNADDAGHGQGQRDAVRS